MDRGKEWVLEYVRVTEAMQTVVAQESEPDQEDQLAALEALILQRQELLDQLDRDGMGDDAKAYCRAAMTGILESEAVISEGIGRMMGKLDESFQEIKDKRAELNLQSRANRSYAGGSASGEGYFIDRRK